MISFEVISIQKEIDEIAGKYMYYLTYPFVSASYFFTYRTLAKIVE